MANENYEAVGSPDGAIIGKSDGKIAFFGGTPAVKATGFTAPAATAATSTTPFGYSEAQANAILVWVRALDAELKAKGIIGA
jgi:hypothetical protein